MMNNTRLTTLISIGILFWGMGCHRENDSPDAVSDRDAQIELELLNNIKLISDWRDYLRSHREHLGITYRIREGLYEIKDPARYKKCLNQLKATIFAYPLDATIPAVRKDQLFAFYEASEYLATYVYARDDMVSFWEVQLHYLKRVKEEMQLVDSFFEGKGGQETFKGERDSWQKYRKRVKGKYESCDKDLTQTFGFPIMALCLNYEKWHLIHSRLEEILEHEVKVSPRILKEMEKK